MSLGSTYKSLYEITLQAHAIFIHYRMNWGDFQIWQSLEMLGFESHMQAVLEDGRSEIER